jgi:hypothetical protein
MTYGLQRFTVSPEVEPPFQKGGISTGAKGGQGLPRRAGGDVGVLGLKSTDYIRLVRQACAKALHRSVIVAEGGKELEFRTAKGLFGRFGDRLFNLDSVHSPPHGLITSIPQPSKSRVLRVATGIPVARAIAAIWQSASAIGRPADRRPEAISA